MAPPLPAATAVAAPLAAAPAKKTSSGRSRGKRSVKKSLEKRPHVHARSKNGGVAVLDAAELEAIKNSAFDEGVAVGVARGEAQLKASKAASMQNLAREKGRNRIARSRLQGEVKAAKKSAATTIAAAEAKRRREEKLAAPAAWSEDKKRRHEKQHEAEKASSKGGHQQKRARQRAAEARKGERR